MQGRRSGLVSSALMIASAMAAMIPIGEPVARKDRRGTLIPTHRPPPKKQSESLKRMLKK